MVAAAISTRDLKFNSKVKPSMTKPDWLLYQVQQLVNLQMAFD